MTGNSSMIVILDAAGKVESSMQGTTGAVKSISEVAHVSWDTRSHIFFVTG